MGLALCPQDVSLLSLPFPKFQRQKDCLGGLGAQSRRQRSRGLVRNQLMAPESLPPPLHRTSPPFSHAQDKNEAAAIFIEGPKLKIGLKHNLKK